MKFSRLDTGSYFFFPSSTIPHYKVTPTHYTEGGSTVNLPASGQEMVIPITLLSSDEKGVRFKIGIYTIHLGLQGK